MARLVAVGMALLVLWRLIDSWQPPWRGRRRPVAEPRVDVLKACIYGASVRGISVAHGGVGGDLIAGAIVGRR